MTVGSLSNLFEFKLVCMLSLKFSRKETGMISIGLSFGKCKFKSVGIKQNVSPLVGLATGPYHATISSLFSSKIRCVSSRVPEEILAVWRGISLQLKNVFVSATIGP